MTSARPQLVAHRGYAGRFPENTLSAIRGALEAQAAWIEIDVQLTRDAEVVLFHDRTLDRVCAERGAIHEHTLAELAHLSAHEPGRFGDEHAGERIASLSDIVALVAEHADVKLFVEVKRVAIENHGIDTVLDRVLGTLEPIAERSMLISFSCELLHACRARCSTPIGAILDSWNEIESEAVRALSPEFTFCNHLKLPTPVDRHRLDVPAGTRLALYEIVDPELAIAYTERGAELIETFEIVAMTQALEKLCS